MRGLTVGIISKDGFTVSAALEGGSIQLRLAGNADMDVATSLNNYLKQLHADACGTGVREVVLDFSRLYFMNSSCFKCFVTWMSQIKKLEPAVRYMVRFQSNPQLHWQRRSLEALRAFAPDDVIIEVLQNGS
jgi:hypothetical protein